MSGLQTAVVAADAITYRLPDQEKPGLRETYLTGSATRGQEVELDQAEYDRLKTLGAIAEKDSAEAAAAKSPKLAGEPFGAVRIASENDNQPIDQLRKRAVETGAADAKDFGEDFTRDHASLAPAEQTDASGDGMTGAVPEGHDATDAKKNSRLNVPQLHALADRYGVEHKSGDTKKSMADAIAKAAKSK